MQVYIFPLLIKFYREGKNPNNFHQKEKLLLQSFTNNTLFTITSFQNGAQLHQSKK